MTPKKRSTHILDTNKKKRCAHLLIIRMSVEKRKRRTPGPNRKKKRSVAAPIAWREKINSIKRELSIPLGRKIVRRGKS